MTRATKLALARAKLAGHDPKPWKGGDAKVIRRLLTPATTRRGVVFAHLEGGYYILDRSDARWIVWEGDYRIHSTGRA